MSADIMAGARAFDTLMAQMAQISGDSFDRDGREDQQAMVQALHDAIAQQLAQTPGHRLGFLLPLAELMDNCRLGVSTSAEQLGTATAGAYLRHAGQRPS